VLHDLLVDTDARRELSARGLALIDGRGRERVADTLLALAGAPGRLPYPGDAPPPSSPTDLDR
jgi:hypothetical protein